LGAPAVLSELADESPALATQLVEPWHVMSLDCRLADVTDVTLFAAPRPATRTIRNWRCTRWVWCALPLKITLASDKGNA
jgi:hypothetical protein